MRRHDPPLKDVANVANTTRLGALQRALQILMLPILGIFLVWGVLTSREFVFNR